MFTFYIFTCEMYFFNNTLHLVNISLYFITFYKIKIKNRQDLHFVDEAVSSSWVVCMNASMVHIHGFVYIFLCIIFWFFGRCCYKLSKHQIIDGSLSPFINTVMLRLKSETSSVVILDKKIRLQKIKIE